MNPVQTERLIRIVLRECEYFNVGGDAHITCPVPGGHSSVGVDGRQYIVFDSPETCTWRAREPEFPTWLANRYRAIWGGECSTGRAVLWVEETARALPSAGPEQLPWNQA